MPSLKAKRLRKLPQEKADSTGFSGKISTY
jgi:hypothetical protein